jgi:hypothetical protein
MPRKYLMSWEGPPKNRWVKMYKGVRYRVTCDELGAMIYTQEGSAKLANQWWKRKQAEIDGPSPLTQMLDAVEEIPIEKLREMMVRGDAVRQILAELPFVKAQIAKEEIERIVGEPIENDTHRPSRSLAGWCPASPKPSPPLVNRSATTPNASSP